MKRGMVFLSALLVGAIGIDVSSREPLTFQERVKAQEAIEHVYYNHRIWPKENPGPKPPFERMVTKEQIEAKVTDYLKKSAALDQFWQRPIEMKQLQAEMERMAKGTKDPATLNELFAALQNDPYLIAECLARPVLADRLIHNWYANDERFHKEAREKAEEALKALTPENFCSYSEGQYSKMTYRLEIEGREELEEAALPYESIKLDEIEFVKMLSEIPEEGKISEINETNDCFIITHTISRNAGEIEVENLTFLKMSADKWLTKQDLTAELPRTNTEDQSLYLPPTPEGVCTEGWDNGVLDNIPPEQARNHSAVWTGNEMIIWGGGDMYKGGSSRGARYNPSTDSWTAVSNGTNCPLYRGGHTAIWTGTEMVIWGGYSIVYSNTGGRYSPVSDSWTATSTGTNCPSGRLYHSAVWTGSEMIVWGGYYNSGAEYYFNNGGRYNPSSDAWTATSTGANCPTKRAYHTAVWTGTEMIIWGGYYYHLGAEYYISDGGRYNPSSDSWTATSTGTDCPSGRRSHSAIWTGSDMIVWGGYYYSGAELYINNTGGRYDPLSNAWSATSTGTDCPSGRRSHSAVWTGSDMIVWGGYDGSAYLGTGGRYAPSSDSWTATSMGANCPSIRGYHTAVWTGTEMVIWGGYDGSYHNSGGRYNPSSDSWVPTSPGVSQPAQRSLHSAVWTGAEMVIWGGFNYSYLSTGGSYTPATDSWMVTSTGIDCPSGRHSHSAVWTGSDMIVWGGYNGSAYLGTGGRYVPSSNSWTTTSAGTNCPSGRRDHSAIWTGDEMIVWGGYYYSGGEYYINDGGRYSPSSDAWTATSIGTDCPSGRSSHTAIWTGSEMIVWGGYSGSQLNSGGKYTPSTDIWTATSTGTNCPSKRAYHTAIWTGLEMIIWGGNGGSGYLGGAKYDTTKDTWTETSTGINCPSFRSSHSAVWTGSEMVIWGGYGYGSPGGYLNTGGRYASTTDSWLQTLLDPGVPCDRMSHKSVWIGGAMIVWGGYGVSSTYLQSGGIYYLPYSPSGLSNNTASDMGCPDTGVNISWSTPSNWGDGATGTRTFDVLRDGVPIAAGLSESTLSYTDTTGDNGTSYLYQVRANNGCGLSTTTTGMSAVDNIGASPEEVANFNDVFSWDPVSGADGYRLYRGTKTDLSNLKTSAADGCLRYEGTATSFDLSADDPSLDAGRLYWYLVTAYAGTCEGTAGEGTGFTRNLSSSGSCP